MHERPAIGVLEEGNTLVYKTTPGGPDQVKCDMYGSTNGIVCGPSHVCEDDREEFVECTGNTTDDGLLTREEGTF